MSISLSDPPVTNTSLGGHLLLQCSARPDGTPFLSKQDFRVPVHIGKGHLDQGFIVLNIANPTAGFFDGDRVDLDITVNPGAPDMPKVESTALRSVKFTIPSPFVSPGQTPVKPTKTCAWSRLIQPMFSPHA